MQSEHVESHLGSLLELFFSSLELLLQRDERAVLELCRAVEVVVALSLLNLQIHALHLHACAACHTLVKQSLTSMRPTRL